MIGEYKTLMETRNPMDRVMNLRNIRQVIANARLIEAMTNVTCSYGVLFYMTRRGWDDTTNIVYGIGFELRPTAEEALENLVLKTFRSSLITPFDKVTAIAKEYAAENDEKVPAKTAGVMYSDGSCCGLFLDGEQITDTQLPYLHVWDSINNVVNRNQVADVVPVDGPMFSAATQASRYVKAGFMELTHKSVETRREALVMIRQGKKAIPLLDVAGPDDGSEDEADEEHISVHESSEEEQEWESSEEESEKSEEKTASSEEEDKSSSEDDESSDEEEDESSSSDEEYVPPLPLRTPPIRRSARFQPLAGGNQRQRRNAGGL